MKDYRPDGWDNYLYRFIGDRVIGTGEPPTQGDMEFAEAIATALMEKLREGGFRGRPMLQECTADRYMLRLWLTSTGKALDVHDIAYTKGTLIFIPEEDE